MPSAKYSFFMSSVVRSRKGSTATDFAGAEPSVVGAMSGAAGAAADVAGAVGTWAPRRNRKVRANARQRTPAAMRMARRVWAATLTGVGRKWLVAVLECAECTANALAGVDAGTDGAAPDGDAADADVADADVADADAT